MSVVPLDKARAGMRLSRSVADESGEVLLGAGAVLTGRLIARLLNANIGSVHIERVLDRAKVEEMLSSLRKRFGKTRHEAHMAMVEELVAEHIEEQYARQEDGSLQGGTLANAFHHTKDGEEAPRDL
jgi:hypothetical protein